MVQLCLSQNGPTLSQNGTGVTKWYSFVTKWYRCHKMVQFSQNGPQQQRRSVVLPFLAQFFRQLRIRSSCKLLNAADWTLCFQIKDHIACIPVV